MTETGGDENASANRVGVLCAPVCRRAYLVLESPARPALETSNKTILTAHRDIFNNPPDELRDR